MRMNKLIKEARVCLLLWTRDAFLYEAPVSGGAKVVVRTDPTGGLGIVKLVDERHGSSIKAALRAEGVLDLAGPEKYAPTYHRATTVSVVMAPRPETDAEWEDRKDAVQAYWNELGEPMPPIERGLHTDLVQVDDEELEDFLSKAPEGSELLNTRALRHEPLPDAIQRWVGLFQAEVESVLQESSAVDLGELLDALDRFTPHSYFDLGRDTRAHDSVWMNEAARLRIVDEARRSLLERLRGLNTPDSARFSKSARKKVSTLKPPPLRKQMTPAQWGTLIEKLRSREPESVDAAGRYTGGKRRKWIILAAVEGAAEALKLDLGASNQTKVQLLEDAFPGYELKKPSEAKTTPGAETMREYFAKRHIWPVS
jgi:hypothetical protein